MSCLAKRVAIILLHALPMTDDPAKDRTRQKGHVTGSSKRDLGDGVYMLSSIILSSDTLDHEWKYTTDNRVIILCFVEEALYRF